MPAPPAVASRDDAGSLVKLDSFSSIDGHTLPVPAETEKKEESASGVVEGSFESIHEESEKQLYDGKNSSGGPVEMNVDEEKNVQLTATGGMQIGKKTPTGLATENVLVLETPVSASARKLEFVAETALEVAVLKKEGVAGADEDSPECSNTRKRKAAMACKTIQSDGGAGESAPDTFDGGEETGGTAVAVEEAPAKKAKKKGASRPKGSRKGGKKTGGRYAANGKKLEEDLLQVAPAPLYSLEDKEMVLSAANKAAQIILSEDKLSATSWKGYRMVRATRGVVEGAWYFEIDILHLGKTGHTRLGWSTQKADVQAPVGYDSNSYAYRDLEGAKVHEALRQPYAEAYQEGDTVGCYISLPGGAALAPKPSQVMRWKGQPFYVEEEEAPKKNVPGSEIAFFRNGVCQETAFADIYAGRYYPAASIYTLPGQTEKATVRFNFGPDFKYPPADWGSRPVPQPMCESKPIEPPLPGPDEEAGQAAGEPSGRSGGKAGPGEGRKAEDGKDGKAGEAGELDGEEVDGRDCKGAKRKQGKGNGHERRGARKKAENQCNSWRVCGTDRTRAMIAAGTAEPKGGLELSRTEGVASIGKGKGGGRLGKSADDKSGLDENQINGSDSISEGLGGKDRQHELEACGGASCAHVSASDGAPSRGRGVRKAEPVEVAFRVDKSGEDQASKSSRAEAGKKPHEKEPGAEETQHVAMSLDRLPEVREHLDEATAEHEGFEIDGGEPITPEHGAEDMEGTQIVEEGHSNPVGSSYEGEADQLHPEIEEQFLESQALQDLHEGRGNCMDGKQMVIENRVQVVHEGQEEMRYGELGSVEGHGAPQAEEGEAGPVEEEQKGLEEDGRNEGDCQAQ